MRIAVLLMHPSADGDLQLFSVSADIRGYLQKLKLRMQIIRGCRSIFTFTYVDRLKHNKLSLFAYRVSVLSSLLPVAGCCLSSLLMSPHLGPFSTFTCQFIIIIYLNAGLHHCTSIVNSALHNGAVLNRPYYCTISWTAKWTAFREIGSFW